MEQTTGEGAGNMKKRIIVALMITLLPAPAYSQKGASPPSGQPTPFDRTAAQKKKDAEVEQAYQQSLKANKAQTPPAKIDPWQSVRPANANDAQR
jgi:hypothetical protein